jgi:hypothetical protein
MDRDREPHGPLGLPRYAIEIIEEQQKNEDASSVRIVGVPRRTVEVTGDVQCKYDQDEKRRDIAINCMPQSPKSPEYKSNTHVLSLSTR